jgi:hypothetical protein
MVKDTFRTKKGAQKWASYSRKKGYKVKVSGKNGHYVVERSRRR